MTDELRVTCFEWGDVGPVDQDVLGCALIERDEDGWGRVGFAVRPGLQPDLFDTLTEWAVSRVARFVEHGPEPDGWQQRSDGGWQLWARVMELPPLD